MTLQDKIDLLIKMGWQVSLINGRWWLPSFHPQQNTLILEQALEYAGLK